MPKIAIIGSNGFIGSHLKKYLSHRKYHVLGIDKTNINSESKDDFRTISSVKNMTLSHLSNVDVIVNAAGSPHVHLSFNNTVGDFKSNCYDTLKILDLIKDCRNKIKYIHISSAAVYGNQKKLPILESAQKKPLTPYGYHKFISEVLCKEYNEIFGIDTVVLRPFSIYGIGLKRQLFWDIFEKSITSTNNEIKLFGNGSESRDFLNVVDLCKFIEILVSSRQNSPFKTFNVGSGIETSIEQITDLIKSIYPHLDFKFTKSPRKGDPDNWQSDQTRAKSIGFEPTISLQYGIKEYYDWAHQDHKSS